MKTIEEKAKEYGLEVSPHSAWTAKNAETSFKAGVEFAQRWILVEEEKPVLWEYVLCKSSVNDHYIGCFFNEKINIDTPNVTITHWRPIELI